MRSPNSAAHVVDVLADLEGAQPAAPPRQTLGRRQQKPTTVLESEHPSLTPMVGARLHAEQQGESVEEISRMLMAGDRMPMRLPASYCESLFVHCASEEAVQLLRSVYYKHGHGELYLLDQTSVNPGDFSEKTSRIMLALRTAALACWQAQHQEHARSAALDDVEDPATKRRLLQQEHVITLQNRKIQELEARGTCPGKRCAASGGAWARGGGVKSKHTHTPHKHVCLGIW